MGLVSVNVIEVSLVNGSETDQPLAPLSPRFTTKVMLFAFLMVKYGSDSGNGRPATLGAQTKNNSTRETLLKPPLVFFIYTSVRVRIKLKRAVSLRSGLIAFSHESSPH